METLNKGIIIPLYPNKNQITQITQFLGNNRFLWNKFLFKNIKYRDKTNKFKFYYDMAMYLVQYKEQYDFLKLSPAQCLQQILKDLDRSLKNCFKNKFGFPKFRKKGLNESIRFSQHFSFHTKSIKFPKLGFIKAKLPDLNAYTIKNITVYKDSTGKYYASLCCKFKPKKLKKTKKTIGLDVGTTYLAIGSNGGFKKAFNKRKDIILLIGKIKKTQRKLSKKIKGSNSYIKCKLFLAKLHKKLRNKRKDYLHKFTTKLVKMYDTIVVEDLKIKNMSKSNKGTLLKPGKMRKQKKGLNRNILSNSWGLLFQYLNYKCSWYNKVFLKVNPKHTSQICSKCGYKHKQNRKSQSEFVCGKCGFEINADVNAAKNILSRGLEIQKAA